MDVVDVWNGYRACALQAALRMTNEGFAGHLGVAVRTVAAWHDKPDLVPRAEMQQVLDSALEQASAGVKSRFALLLDSRGGRAGTVGPVSSDRMAQALRVAIAVVLKESDVLIVCRRGEDAGGITWQFPAGVVKPGVASATVAVHETLAETGVHCTVRNTLGSRLHPVTNVLCDYLLCDYLAGEAENKDVVENVSVTWAPCNQVTRFIPADRIFPPILKALEEQHDAAGS